METVFEILGEGGSIRISRQGDKRSEKYFYNHSECDPTEEGLEVGKSGVYDTFEEPFQRINKTYCWYRLYLETVHEDFRAYILAELTMKLRNDKVKPGDLGSSRTVLEEVLQAKLIF